MRWREGLDRAIVGRVTIVVRLDAPWMFMLLGSDEVSIGRPYHLRTFVLRDGHLARPRDYVEDVP